MEKQIWDLLLVSPTNSCLAIWRLSHKGHHFDLVEISLREVYKFETVWHHDKRKHEFKQIII